MNKLKCECRPKKREAVYEREYIIGFKDKEQPDQGLANVSAGEVFFCYSMCFILWFVLYLAEGGAL